MLAVGDLLHTLLPEFNPQTGVNEGYSVATNEIYHVVGKPRADLDGFVDSGAVEVYDAATNTHIATIHNPQPGADDWFGRSVSISGDSVVVGAPVDDTGALGAGSVYVYDLSSGNPVLQATINNPTPVKRDYFGFPVSISNDTVVVGAYSDDTGAVDAGSAYVYDISGGTAVLQATINNPTPATGDYFGVAVAVEGNRVVVGAQNYITNHTGNAYVYDISGGSAVLEATIDNPTSVASDRFGLTVATGGDRVVVGADNAGASNGGRVYVYDVSGGSAVLEETINNPTPAAGDFFGAWGVSVSDDNVVVGAYLDNGSGSAYLYDLGGGSAVLQSTINNPTPAAGDWFALSVAVDGNTLIVGAVFDDTLATDAGSAYVYDISSGSAVFGATLNDPTPATGDRFGWRVAASGNLVVVGADGLESTGANDSGTAYIYDLSSGNPVQHLLHNPTPASGDLFGRWVAADGDTVVVGARDDDTGAVDAGSAYIYDFSSGSPVLQATINNPEPDAGDGFGSIVAVNGNTVAVTAIGDDWAVVTGTTYVYDISGASPELKATINNPTPEAGDLFGWVDISGEKVVIGATRDDVGAVDAGSVYVYDLSSGSPVLSATINNPTPEASDQFGILAIHGDTLLVGAPGDRTGARDAGSAYIYDLSSGSPVLQATINNPEPAMRDYFGGSVGISGDNLVVGAFGDGTGSTGSAYLYDLSTGSPVLQSTINSPTPERDDVFGLSVATTTEFAVVGAYGDAAINKDQGAVYIFDASTNSPPTDIMLSSNDVDENAASGTVIGTLSAIDPDPGESFAFSEVTDPDGKFAVVDDELLVDGQLDFETATSHTVTIRVTDSGGATLDKQFTIDVNDINTVDGATEVIDAVQELNDTGVLSNGEANPIINHLNQAIKDWNKGKISHAIQKLEQARDKIQDLIDNVDLDSDLGQPLIDSINDIIDEILSESAQPASALTDDPLQPNWSEAIDQAITELV